MSEEESSKEEVILRAVKKVLTDVVKDTATAPGLMHPLKDQTIISIRDCLVLISNREQELAKAAGREMNLRPHYKDEPKSDSEVVVPLHKIGKPKKKED